MSPQEDWLDHVFKLIVRSVINHGTAECTLFRPPTAYRREAVKDGYTYIPIIPIELQQAARERGLVITGYCHSTGAYLITAMRKEVTK